MNFLTVSKEQKLEIYNKRINNVEQEIFAKVLELGIDADFFDFNELKSSPLAENVIKRTLIYYY